MTDPRLEIGGNSPPEPTPFEAIKVHASDLLVEARNWADGSALESQAQADEISFLIDQLRKAAKVAEDVRKAEVKPLDDAKKAIQERFKGLSDPIDRAVTSCKAVLTPWLEAVERKQREAAETARKVAAEASEKASQAARAASATDLASQDEAATTLKIAEQAAKGAARLEKAKPHAVGGARAIGLRTVWNVAVVDEVAAIRTMWKRYPAEFVALATTLAERDVRAGNRAIEGFSIEAEKVAA